MLRKMYNQVIYDEKVYERIMLWGSTLVCGFDIFWDISEVFEWIFTGVLLHPPP